MARSKIFGIGKNKNRNSPIHPIYGEYRDIANRWMLELLVPLGAHKEMILEHLCREDDVLHELGLSDLAESNPFDPVVVRKALFDLYKVVSDKPLPKTPPLRTLLKILAGWGE